MQKSKLPVMPTRSRSWDSPENWFNRTEKRVSTHFGILPHINNEIPTVESSNSRDVKKDLQNSFVSFVKRNIFFSAYSIYHFSTLRFLHHRRAHTFIIRLIAFECICQRAWRKNIHTAKPATFRVVSFYARLVNLALGFNQTSLRTLKVFPHTKLS